MSRITIRDDRGVVGVVGFVLLFALALTLYANAVRSDVPRWGAEAERSWDAELAEAFGRLAHDMAGGIGKAEAVRTVFPASTVPKALDVPILGRTEPFRASGAITFRDDCEPDEGGVRMYANHSDGSFDIQDVVSSVCGRLAFVGQPSYSPAFGYRMEYGGLLRIQGDAAVVVSGPLLDVRATDDDPNTGYYEVALTVPDAFGESVTAALDRSSVTVALTPGPATPELVTDPNAAWIEWELETPYAEAWERWFAERFELAGLECGSASTDDCLVDRTGDRLTVIVRGPRTSAISPDLVYSLSYGVFQVSVE